MLNLSLTAVARGEQTIDGVIAPDDPLWADTGVALLEPLRAELRGSEVGEGVLVRGRVHGRLAQQCRRCLAPVEWVLDDAVDMLFESISDEEEQAELAGEVYPLPARGDLVDLGPPLREQVLLRVPAFVLCDEECRGLCPQCGADRNRSDCACVPAEAESPWQALKKLKFD